MRKPTGKPLWLSYILIALVASILYPVAGQAKERVAVGGYLFPPFVNNPLSDSPGVTFQLIEALNQEQDRFEFYFVPTGANRRYYSFVNREFDVILFESPNWGWVQQELQFDVSEPFHYGGEVYVTLDVDDRDQSWFDSLPDRSICGIFGYHYGFADFVSDTAVLEKQFDIFLADRPGICLNMVLHQRADLSIVTKSWLSQQLSQNPDLADRLLISDRLDQEYQHQAILHPESPVQKDDLNRWLQAIGQRGDIERMVSGNRALN